jgi:hypothetical protein
VTSLITGNVAKYTVSDVLNIQLVEDSKIIYDLIGILFRQIEGWPGEGRGQACEHGLEKQRRPSAVVSTYMLLRSCRRDMK